MDPADDVLVGRSGRTLTIRLNRPASRNAQDPALWQALARIGRELPDDLGAIVLTGEGASFSAGLDRRMLTPAGIPGQASLASIAVLPAAQQDALLSQYQDAFRWWRRCPVPTIAAVGGHAVGAGFQLALACDLIVVADDALLAMREPSLGLVPDLGGTLPLVAAVGYQRALEIVATGRWVDAEEAVRIGLAVRSVPRSDLEAQALGLAEELGRVDPGALRETRRLLQDAVVRAGGTFAAAHDAQMAAERAAQSRRLAALTAHPTG